MDFFACMATHSLILIDFGSKVVVICKLCCGQFCFPSPSLCLLKVLFSVKATLKPRCIWVCQLKSCSFYINNIHIYSETCFDFAMIHHCNFYVNLFGDIFISYIVYASMCFTSFSVNAMAIHSTYEWTLGW